MGAKVLGRWQTWQRRSRIGATSLVNVTCPWADKPMKTADAERMIFISPLRPAEVLVHPEDAPDNAIVAAAAEGVKGGYGRDRRRQDPLLLRNQQYQTDAIPAFSSGAPGRVLAQGDGANKFRIDVELGFEIFPHRQSALARPVVILVRGSSGGVSLDHDRIVGKVRHDPRHVLIQNGTARFR